MNMLILSGLLKDDMHYRHTIGTEKSKEIRLSTIQAADQILVMSEGRIIERGTHRDLLERAGAYAAMWALQQQEEDRSVTGPR